MTIVVGHPTRTHDRAAISLGAMLARSIGTDLLVVSVVPAPWPTLVAGNVDKEYAAWSREAGAAAVADAERVLAEVAADLESRADRRRRAARSRRPCWSRPPRSTPGWSSSAPPRTGRGTGWRSAPPPTTCCTPPTSRSRWRRGASPPTPYPGSPGRPVPSVPTGPRATCCAVRPRSAPRPGPTCGSRPSASSARPCTRRRSAASRTCWTRSSSRPRRPCATPRPPPASATSTTSSPPAGTGRRRVGRLEWRHDDVLVLGSSPRGVLARVFVGSHASRIIRHSPVPVVVVPES